MPEFVYDLSIVGSGNFGRALATLAQYRGLRVCIGTRKKEIKSGIVIKIIQQVFRPV